MTLTEIMQSIESYGFSSEVNMASGTKAFRRILRGHELVHRLAELAKQASVRAAVAQRVEELSALQIDKQYENRFDSALSAYLTVLSDTSAPDVVAKAAQAAAKAENTWWTVGLSRELVTRAIATGWSAARMSHAHIILRLASNADWQESIQSGFVKWMAGTIPVTVGTVTGAQILRALRTAEEKAQVPKKNNLIVMPPSEEGETLAWKPGRRRLSRHEYAKAAAAVPQRTRQAARA